MMFIKLMAVCFTIRSSSKYSRTVFSLAIGPRLSRSIASKKGPGLMMQSSGIAKSGSVDQMTLVCSKNLQKKLNIGSNSCKDEGSFLGVYRKHDTDFGKAIFDLNSLQSNTKTISLAKYKSPKDILPLFVKQLNLAGLHVDDLNQLNIIHISGTKGKGSSCAFVESILRANGLKTGFYNSPHLINVTERIRIDGNQIDNDLFCKYFREIFDRLSLATKREGITMPTYFSFLTILAFYIFIREKVDCAVIEVGIGGEYDPTNIIQQPIVCGISTIHFDHVNILGESIESIAWSKAGIAKKNVPIFTVEQDHEAALRVIKSRAREKSCPIHICKDLQNCPDLHLGISGSAQKTNASLAIQLAKYFLADVSQRRGSSEKFTIVAPHTIETDFKDLCPTFKEALASCSWPGRCQILRYPHKRLTFFLDGAHTKESMDNCVDWFLNSSEKEDHCGSRILMVNIIGERDKSEILRPLCHRECRFDEAIFSTNRIGPCITNPEFQDYDKDHSDRGMDNAQCNASVWNNLLKEHNAPNKKFRIISNTIEGIHHVIELSKLNPGSNYHVLATGSLHFVGAMLETLLNIDSLHE